jgi:uncharacterized protein (TIGR00369 family)
VSVEGSRTLSLARSVEDARTTARAQGVEDARTPCLARSVENVRTRTISWTDPAALAAESVTKSGLEYLRGIAAGRIPRPPIAELINSLILEVEPGRVVFAADPAEWMYNPIGSVHGGIAAALLDSCMGCAVHTTLEAGVGYTTTDLQVRYIRPLIVSTGRVLAEGRVVHAGRRTATAEGRLFVESDHNLIAHATTGCAILR